MYRRLPLPTAMALAGSLLMATPGAANDTGYYPVVIDIETEYVESGELRGTCITKIIAANPMVLTIEKEGHEAWFDAASGDGPKVKWIVLEATAGYTWTIEQKPQMEPHLSHRRFFGSVPLGKHAARRTNIDDNQEPALGDQRYRWHYNIVAEVTDQDLKSLCRGADIGPVKKLDPQIVFNGGSGADLCPCP